MSADLEYARRCRDAVRPLECTRALACWGPIMAERNASQQCRADAASCNPAGHVAARSAMRPAASSCPRAPIGG